MEDRLDAAEVELAAALRGARIALRAWRKRIVRLEEENVELRAMLPQIKPPEDPPPAPLPEPTAEKRPPKKR